MTHGATMRFKVVGNRQTLHETLLWESDSLTEAKRWLDRYARDNRHGFAFIEVIEDAEDRPFIHYEWESFHNDLD